MRNHLFTLALFVLCAGCDHPPSERNDASGLIDQRTSVDQVRKALATNDAGQMSRSIVQLSLLKQREGVRELLAAAWSDDRTSYPDLNWQLLSTPSARVAIAQVLGSWNPGDSQYLDYVRTVTRTGGDEAKFDALMALGVLGDASDLSYLESVANGSDEMLATAALSGLLASGNESAIRMLEAAARNTALPEQRRQLAGQLLGMPRAAATPDL